MADVVKFERHESRYGVLEGISQRLPPTNLHAEQALLGALLANNKGFERVGGFLRAEHFADPCHAAIYAAIARRIGEGQAADPVTMRAEFEHTGVLEAVGGFSYLGQLLKAVVGQVNVPDYARTIRDAWMRRKIIDVGETLVNRAFGADPDYKTADGMIAEAVAQLDDMNNGTHAARQPVTITDAIEQAIDAGERAGRGEVSGISTGWPSIDAMIGGLEPGCLYILAARPGMGKSAMGLQIALHVARDKIGCGVVSLEMQAAQLGRRALAYISGIPAFALRRGQWSREDANRIAKARRAVHDMPLTIIDEGGQNTAMIALKARNIKRKHGLGLLVIDHLHIVSTDSATTKMGETWAVGKVSNDLKRMAKDLNIPIIALAQLSRGPENREDKRPTLADLRQSGNIEQDADAVIFLYRAEYYLSKTEPERAVGCSVDAHRKRVADWIEAKERLAGKAEAIFAKVREGETGSVIMGWDGARTSFSEISE